MKEIQRVQKLDSIVKLFKNGESVPFNQLLEMSDISILQLLTDFNNCDINEIKNRKIASIENEEDEVTQINRLRNKLRLKAIEKKKFLHISIEDLLIDAIILFIKERYMKCPKFLDKSLIIWGI